MNDTLGDRIRARRAARIEQHIRDAKAHTDISGDELRVYVDEQLAAVHARIDKLATSKRSPRK